jgi:hypothetical protein
MDSTEVPIERPPDRLKKFDHRSGKIQHPVRCYMMIMTAALSISAERSLSWSESRLEPSVLPDGVPLAAATKKKED